jgi:hypothetical protein
MKYVMFGEALPVIFGEYFEHKQVTAGFSQQATSAGFFNVSETGKVTTYGESIGLKLKPAPDDEFLLGNVLKHLTICQAIDSVKV